MRRALAAFCIWTAGTTAASADGPALREKLSALFEKAANEHRTFFICLNGDRTIYDMIETHWLRSLRDAAEALQKDGQDFDPVFVNTLRFDAIQRAKPDDDMTLKQQRELCEADKDWSKRLRYLKYTLLDREIETILEGD